MIDEFALKISSLRDTAAHYHARLLLYGMEVRKSIALLAIVDLMYDINM